MGFIPWDMQLKYAEYVGLDQDNIEGFIAIISKLDHAYLEWVASERKNKSG